VLERKAAGFESEVLGDILSVGDSIGGEAVERVGGALTGVVGAAKFLNIEPCKVLCTSCGVCGGVDEVG